VRARKLIFSAIVLGFLATSIIGEAQVAPEAPPAPANLGMDALDVFNMIADGIDSKLNSLSSSNALIGARDIILGVGLAIGLFWTGLKTMVAGKGIGELLGEWIPILITAGVVTAFTAPGPLSVGVQISNTLDKVAGAITMAASGTAVDTSSVRKVTESAVKTTYNTVVAIAQTSRNNEAASWGDVLAVLKNIPIAFFAGLMKIFASLVIVVAMCVYMATAVMAMMSIKLVIALAPVMVPFLIFKPTAWLFDSWLKFLLGGGMLKLVGAFMLSMTGGLMAGINTVAQKIKLDAEAGTVDSYAGDIVLFSSLFLIAILCSLLMAQVPSIASGLLAGSAGGSGFSSLKGVTQTLGAKSATAITNSAAQGTRALGQAAHGAYQKRNAAKTAHRDAVAGGPLGGRGYSNQKAKSIYSQVSKEASAVQAALGEMEKKNRSRPMR